MTGKVLNIKRLTVHDGPGIRTTIFTKGCPLRCNWCHNPESISPENEIGFLKKKCIACGKCVDACPTGAHSFLDGIHIFDQSKCTACGKCIEVCLPGALEYYGTEMTVDTATKAVMDDRNFYINSGGGCTISGGEPLSQPDFCAEVFKRLQEYDIHCTIDTSGVVPWKNFETVLPYTNMFLYDIKHLDDKKHREQTGGSNRLILDNLKRLAKCETPIEIRIPIIPEFNADNASIDAIGNFLSGMPNITAVRILPYYGLSRSKYEAIGRTDTMLHVPVPDTRQMNAIAIRLEKFGMNVFQ